MDEPRQNTGTPFDWVKLALGVIGFIVMMMRLSSQWQTSIEEMQAAKATALRIELSQQKISEDVSRLQRWQGFARGQLIGLERKVFGQPTAEPFAGEE